ncbi:MAG TPA: hypothetical protein VHB97_16355, partial [Polyangia bacterium]|nr:hypothetical protein [Polyangia bacterium]
MAYGARFTRSINPSEVERALAAFGRICGHIDIAATRPIRHDGRMSEPHCVAMLAFAGAQILDVVGPLEVFSRAARLVSDDGRRGRAPYTIEILAPAAGPVVTSSGVALVAARGYR